MNNIDIKTDAQKVFQEFQKFTLKEMQKAEKEAIKKAAGQLQKEVRKSLKKSLPNASKKSDRYTDTLIKGVRSTGVKKGKNNGEQAAYVTIMSNRQQGSGSFRLIFFEMGTTERYAYTRKTDHKPAYRGKIHALNFYESAYSRFKNDYDKIIDDELAKAIEKINKKKNFK